MGPIPYPTVRWNYEQMREGAYRDAQMQLVGLFPTIILTTITSTAITAYWKHWLPHMRHQDCSSDDWIALVSKFRRHPKRFEMALWDGETTGEHLHGLVIGAPTRRKYTVQIDYCESFPYQQRELNQFRGKVFHIAQYALTHYGHTIEASSMCVVNVCSKLAEHCQKDGFTIASSHKWPYECYDITKSLL